jgi:hypothetical protein
MVEARGRGEVGGPDLGRVADGEGTADGSGCSVGSCGTTAGGTRAGRVGRLRVESGEVGREPLGQTGGNASKTVADRGGASDGEEELRGRQQRGALDGADGPLVSRVERAQRSISSPKNSILIGSGIDGGKTSTIPPRRADSPRPATSVTGTYPRSNNSWSSVSWLMRTPGRSSRGAAGRSAGSMVCWRSAWTLATRTRARPLRHAASAATRAAVSSGMSSLRS